MYKGTTNILLGYISQCNDYFDGGIDVVDFPTYKISFLYFIVCSYPYPLWFFVSKQLLFYNNSAKFSMVIALSELMDLRIGNYLARDDPIFIIYMFDDFNGFVTNLI